MAEIGSSVGRTNQGQTQCYNDPKDQQIVVGLLNRIDTADGGTRQAPLTASGRWQYCPPELHQAILTFQRRNQGLSVDGHIDPGGSAMAKLNTMAGKAAAAPAAAAPVVAPASPDAFPPPYDALPAPLQQTILRTYKNKTSSNNNFAWQLGFVPVKIEMTLGELLTKLDAAGHLDVLKDVYTRTARAPGLWDRIHEVLAVWDLAAGQGVSSGFDFTCVDPDHLLSFMQGRLEFCADDPTTAVHGPRDCFRELITSGPGLHVCVTQTAARATHDHDIHIDRWQVVCARKADGFCEYKYANQQFVDHMRDAAPWWVKKQASELRKKLGALTD